MRREETPVQVGDRQQRVGVELPEPGDHALLRAIEVAERLARLTRHGGGLVLHQPGHRGLGLAGGELGEDLEIGVSEAPFELGPGGRGPLRRLGAALVGRENRFDAPEEGGPAPGWRRLAAGQERRPQATRGGAGERELVEARRRRERRQPVAGEPDGRRGVAGQQLRADDRVRHPLDGELDARRSGRWRPDEQLALPLRTGERERLRSDREERREEGGGRVGEPGGPNLDPWRPRRGRQEEEAAGGLFDRELDLPHPERPAVAMPQQHPQALRPRRQGERRGEANPGLDHLFAPLDADPFGEETGHRAVGRERVERPLERERRALGPAQEARTVGLDHDEDVRAGGLGQRPGGHDEPQVAPFAAGERQRRGFGAGAAEVASPERLFSRERHGEKGRERGQQKRAAHRTGGRSNGTAREERASPISSWIPIARR